MSGAILCPTGRVSDVINEAGMCDKSIIIIIYVSISDVINEARMCGKSIIIITSLFFLLSVLPFDNKSQHDSVRTSAKTPFSVQ